MKKVTRICLFGVVIIFFTTAFSYGTIVTSFPSTNIGGGIYASAEAQVTTGTGYIDISVKNTSLLGPTIDGKIANPFIWMIEFLLPNGFTMDETNSYVSSLTGSLFAQGDANPALNLSVINLNYNIENSHTNKNKCFETGQADNIQNDNTIASINVLDGSLIPQEGHAIGFLDTNPQTDSGAVFDEVRFHVALNESLIPDENFYTAAQTLELKYQGGGNFSMYVENVPEPATLWLLGLGGSVLLRKRK